MDLRSRDERIDGRPGAPLLDDAEEWESVIEFPTFDDAAWEASRARAEAFYRDQNGVEFARKTTIFTGFFERLISWMDFENAAVALIDDDQKDSVHAMFDRLADLYLSLVDRFKDYWNIDVVELHDDWGSQNSTLVSEETLREMVLPHLKRVIDRVHERGMLFELHSCGKIENLVPLMIDAGVDNWMGQTINEKLELVREYGDRIVIDVEAPELGADATDEEVRAAAEAFARDFFIPGKPCSLSVYSACQSNPPLMTDELYRLSRNMFGSA